MKKIVVIGGGTGTFTVLSGLKKYTKNLSAIVAMSDSGGSTGRLRDELGVLPPGDIRMCLVALASSDKLLRSLFNYRFKEGVGLKGHNFGNLFLTALEKLTGSFEKGVKCAAQILAIDGEVIPVTTQNTDLWAELENGQKIRGEANIDRPHHDANLKITKVWLQPRAKVNPRALEAIKEADLVVIGPGGFYTSVIPNLLVQGLALALQKSQSKKVFVCNLMTKFGETNNFEVDDFVAGIEKYLGKSCLDYVIFNEAKFPKKLLRRYAKEKKAPVKFSAEKRNKNIKYISADLTSHKILIRHDPEKLARLIMKILDREDGFKYQEY